MTECGLFSIALGTADYDPEADNSLQDVFERADEMMYSNKKQKKKELI